MTSTKLELSRTYSLTLKKRAREQVTVRQFKPTDEDVASILDSISEAFKYETLAMYFSHDANDAAACKALALEQFWIYMRCMSEAGCYFTLSNLKGGMLAFDLPKEKISIFNQLIHGLPKMLWQMIPWHKWLALAQGEDYLEASRYQYIKENGLDSLLHLFAIGIHPELQGQGMGGLLLQELTSHADKSNQHCYLEASTESSKRFYERHGFILFKE